MNMYDYLDWRGDLSFDQSEFNEVDNLLLSYIAYTVLDDLVRREDRMTIAEAADLFFAHHSESEIRESKSFVSQSPLVLRKMAGTKRFRDCVITNYCSRMNYEDTVQFMAMTVDLDSETSYVSFRGTDGSMIGWHEDLNITYEITDAQRNAVNYVNESCDAGRKLIFGGHSKGGNLAVFAAMYCEDRIRNSIIHIYNNDGPGISDVSYDEKAYKAIEDRVIKIAPCEDVVGVIYDRDRDPVIVKSGAFFILQHDALSWQIQGDHFVRAERFDEITDVIREIVSEFLANSSPLECHIFSDSVFRAIDEAGIRDLSEFSTDGIRTLFKAFREIIDIDTEAKKVGRKFRKIAARAVARHILTMSDRMRLLLSAQNK